MDTKQMIAVMQAYVDGKEIQVRERYVHKRDDDGWANMSPIIPRWDWSSCEFRVKPKVHEYWLSVYPLREGGGRPSVLYTTREATDTAAMSDRIACIKISFTEGEGL